MNGSMIWNYDRFRDFWINFYIICSLHETFYIFIKVKFQAILRENHIKLLLDFGFGCVLPLSPILSCLLVPPPHFVKVYIISCSVSLITVVMTVFYNSSKWIRITCSCWFKKNYMQLLSDLLFSSRENSH